MVDDEEVSLLIENAQKLHGHLGPFLVLGVRIGRAARMRLTVGGEDSETLRVTIKTPLFTPYSCVIDGIQATTSCTVGNRRLKTQDSAGKIVALFKLESSPEKVKISVKSEVVKTLIRELSEGADAEQLASRIAQMREQQLFVLE